MTPVVHVLVPEGLDDRCRASGGNTYDRRLCEALSESGRPVRVVEVAGGWPWSAELGCDALESALRAVPDGSLVVVDGLLASRLPRAMVPASARLRVVLLMHMPVGGEAECAVVHAASAVVAPSAWCRTWLLRTHGLDPARVHVARPGVDAAPATTGRPAGGRLVCVGAVTPDKGQDLLLAALVRVADLSWTCRCVGTVTLAPRFVEELRRDARVAGLAHRFTLPGPQAARELGATCAEADALVVASRAETYGMVVTEALAHGLPVIAFGVGGVPEALGGETGHGTRAGILVPPGDVTAMGRALRRWLSEARLRDSLRSAAIERRARLDGWSVTAGRVDRVLREVVA